MASLNSHNQTVLDDVTAKEPRPHGDDIFSSATRKSLVPFECGIDVQRLPRCSTRYIMGRIVFFGAPTETVAGFAG